MKTKFPRLPADWRTALLSTSAARLALAAWGVVVFNIGLRSVNTENRLYFYYGLQPITSGAAGALWGIWQRWDSIYYIMIATQGYTNFETSAFFPLYPALGRLVSALSGLDALVSLSLVSLVCTALAMLLLYRITERHIDPAWAAPAVIMAVFYPSSYFLLALYPQSLALLLVLTTLWLALQRRWLAAALTGLAAGLTHATSAPLVAALLVIALGQNWQRVRGWMPAAARAWIEKRLPQPADTPGRGAWLSFLAALAPPLGTAVFLAWRLGQGYPPLAGFVAQNWGRSAQWPWLTLLELPLIYRSYEVFASGLVNVAAVLVGIAVAAWSIRRLPTWLWVYQITGLLALLSQDTADSVATGFSRYSLLLFPIFITLAAWTHNRPRLRLLVFMLLGLVQLYLCQLFFLWVFTG